ncbi:MAG: phosphodiesterase [Christensenellales bacterium]
MKLFIASDIHGSYHYAKLIKECFERERADILLLLGDIYNHGPRNPFPQEYAPMKVAEVLNSMADKLIVVKGNCDSEVDQMISDFTFVATAMVDVDGIKVFATHGHVHNIDNMASVRCDVMVYGHFHQGFIVRKNGVVIANPSSASLPKEGQPHGYLIVENNVITLKDLSTNQILDTKEIK